MIQQPLQIQLTVLKLPHQRKMHAALTHDGICFVPFFFMLLQLESVPITG